MIFDFQNQVQDDISAIKEIYNHASYDIGSGKMQRNKELCRGILSYRV